MPNKITDLIIEKRFKYFGLMVLEYDASFVSQTYKNYFTKKKKKPMEKLQSNRMTFSGIPERSTNKSGING